MDEYRKITVTRATPSGEVTEEHDVLVRRYDPNNLEQQLPVEPQLILRVADGGEREVPIQVADLIAIALD